MCISIFLGHWRHAKKVKKKKIINSKVNSSKSEIKKLVPHREHKVLLLHRQTGECCRG